MKILEKLLRKEAFIKGIDHVAIVVKDMDRSIEFYGETLGLVVLHDGRNDGGNKKSFLGTNEKSLVAITEDPLKDIDSQRVESVSHIAFQVVDVEKVKGILESRGIEFIEEKVGEGGSKAYHFLDPDGFELEIYEGSRGVAPY